MIFLLGYDIFDWIGSFTDINTTLGCCKKSTSVALNTIEDEYIAVKKKER